MDRASTTPPTYAPAPPLRDIAGWAVALIVVGGVLLQGAVGAAALIPMFLARNADSTLLGSPLGNGEPPVQADAVALDTAVPAGWTTVTSPSGRMTFAVDPGWEAYGGDEPDSFIGVEGPDLWEFAGTWYVGNAGYVTISASHEYSYVWPVQEDAQWYIDPDGGGQPTTTVSRAITTDAGYAAYEMAADADEDGYAYEECVIVLDTGTSSVYVYASSDDPSLVCTDMVRPVAQSLVVD